jgi:hypothetical protein
MMAAEFKQDDKMDTSAMQAAYQQLAAPGAPHKQLASMAGRWHTHTKTWMEPGKAPVESEGKSELKMILSGRYLQQEFTGDMMGTPFIGIGFTGYDNHGKKYVSTWIDSMSTGIFYFEGTADEGGRTITQYCRFDDAVRGPLKWRSVTQIVDDNTHLFEMYLTDKSDKEIKMMEITYTRA